MPAVLLFLILPALSAGAECSGKVSAAPADWLAEGGVVSSNEVPELATTVSTVAANRVQKT